MFTNVLLKIVCPVFRRGELGAAGRVAAGAEAGGNEEAQAVENLTITFTPFLWCKALLSTGTLPFRYPIMYKLQNIIPVPLLPVHVMFKFNDVDNRMTNVYMFIVLINYNEACKLFSESFFLYFFIRNRKGNLCWYGTIFSSLIVKEVVKIVLYIKS